MASGPGKGERISKHGGAGDGDSARAFGGERARGGRGEVRVGAADGKEQERENGMVLDRLVVEH